MKEAKLIPPNLAILGVTRKIPAPKADLITIYKTPYPVLKGYGKLCKVMAVTPYGGGDWQKQDDRHLCEGLIISGYRSEVLEYNVHSPHRFALALDIHVGDVEKQMEWATAAQPYFCRVGLYVGRNTIHLDLCNKDWQAHYKGAVCWVWSNGVYHPFPTLKQALESLGDLDIGG